ncbi:acyclic terpene utilization AtuA family protein [Streptomyces sp. NPDC047061]|uniref:acyclic terpene utilization AtuA family protein n=1 Tax=Streptomyces sp. NPDC047061 TaxID=3154605 RepID=UPI0033F682A8
MPNRMVRIAAGCSVDVTSALPQMARYGEVDYLVLDYLMEHGLAKMAAARAADPEAGYAAGFLGPDILGELGRLLANGTRIIASAGGLNPLRCAELFRRQAAEIGLSPRIAVVHGDDVLDLAGPEQVDMFTGERLPDRLVSSNVYLGAAPIAAVLAGEPDIVITGRVVDSALSLGPLLHEFGWPLDDYDLMAAGSLVGHLLECGAQPSGGIHTDWREIDFADTSFPIAEVHDDGGIVITKAPGTGGRISFGTIAEQLTYEISDPQRYFLPDVTLDSSRVTLEEVGPDRIRISGAKGYPPTSTYKVCSIEHVGWRGVLANVIAGEDADEKARKTMDAVIARAEIINERNGWGPFTSTGTEVIGSGDSLGAHARPVNPQEVVYRLVADHPNREAVDSLLRVHGATYVSMSPGTCYLSAEARPLMRVWSFLLDKDQVDPLLTVDGEATTIKVPRHDGFHDGLVRTNTPLTTLEAPDGVAVPLERLAYTRSGDKGDMANVSVVARDPRFLPYLAHALTTESVKTWFRHVFSDPATARVDRFEMPGIGALNFLLHHGLDGGAVSSRRFDDMGKTYGQQLTGFPVRVPSVLIE